MKPKEGWRGLEPLLPLFAHTPGYVTCPPWETSTLETPRATPYAG